MAALVLAALASSALANSPFANASARSLLPRVSSGCGTSGQQSCSTSSTKGTCCFEAPGGLLLQTQFWDTDPSTGPSNSWTIHGLWPDNCNGTFSENCDPSRDYTGISTLLQNAGATSTLSFMETFWKNDPDDGSDEELWEHEWATHGTCYSTLQPSCLPSGSPTGTEAVAFFETVVNLFQTVPTYQFLADEGITPSSSKTFTLSQITSALKAASGFSPTVTCSGSNLDQISWYFNLIGSVIDGEFIQIDAPSFTSNSCPSSGIKYPLKSGSPVSTGPTSTSSGGGSSPSSTSSSSGGSPTGVPSSFQVNALMSGGTTQGGLLSTGTWSTQTLATYKAATSGNGFTLTTSKGSCAVSGGSLSCGNGASSVFTAVALNNGQTALAFNGETTFSSNDVPSGTDQETVFTGSDHANTYQLIVA